MYVPSCQIDVPPCQINDPPAQINVPPSQINVPLSNKFPKFLRHNFDPRDIYLLECHIFVSIFDHVYGPLQEQIKPLFIAPILDPYEVTPDEFVQIEYVLFAHVNAAEHFAVLKP